MCGIFGCISDDAAVSVLEGLRMLEYRGYDSAGLAAILPGLDSPIETEKTTGYVSDLVSKANGRFSQARVSIGHTRWATHGGVTDTNAHPHSSSDGKITIVHNGIIENAHQLQQRVKKLGYELNSETDSEVIVHLFHHEIENQPDNLGPLDAFLSTISLLKGSWAIAAIMSGSESILVARNGAPLVVGKGHNSICISSDVQALYGKCMEVAYLRDGDVWSVSKKGLVSPEGCQSPVFEILEGNAEMPDLGHFPHFMMKEIHDQPISISNVLGGRISSDGLNARLGGFSLSPEEMGMLRRINLIACGTAFYAAEIGSFLIREHSNITVEAFRSSEFNAEKLCGPDTLTIGISQSGETKDTLDALQSAKMSGGEIASLCNVIGSTISRYTSNGAYLYAGQEYSVASTKAFTNMIAALVLLSITLASTNKERIAKIVQAMRELPNKISKLIKYDDGSIEDAVELIYSSEKVLFIGRGVSAPLAQEGALKMMEIAYLPCIAYPGGELKHGPIALIENGTPVVAIAPSDETLNLMESTVRECKSRGAQIILITDSEGPITNFADVLIQTPDSILETSTILNAIPLQLLAYEVATKKELNVDRPRNLAKSVTVV